MFTTRTAPAPAPVPAPSPVPPAGLLRSLEIAAAEDWSAKAVHDAFSVHVLWRTPGGGWGGRAATVALGG
ncbi:hypothetical protein [Streptomyces chilikensis]|uniref:hypothetical protein n=1 Tax=Streptomyces chilikensis TaxID=1194079 RepID=UPI00140D8DDC|nr:hypothetical protein [Streptomyces chilikensis]